jgi:ATP-dependent DNA ligase
MIVTANNVGDIKALPIPFSERYKICQYLASLHPCKELQLVSQNPILLKPDRDHPQLADIQKQVEDEGYEGIMIRHEESWYVYSRSDLLRKGKSFSDDEFQVVGAVEGLGKRKGAVGAFICKTPDGKEFNVSPPGDENEMRKLWKNPNLWKGKWLTVKYFELSKDGIPRFPKGKSFREKGKGML